MTVNVTDAWTSGLQPIKFNLKCQLLIVHAIVFILFWFSLTSATDKKALIEPEIVVLITYFKILRIFCAWTEKLLHIYDALLITHIVKKLSASNQAKSVCQFVIYIIPIWIII